MRTALMGGEVVDIIINTWPAFRAELIDAGILRPVDEEWETVRLERQAEQVLEVTSARSTARPTA